MIAAAFSNNSREGMQSSQSVSQSVIHCLSYGSGMDTILFFVMRRILFACFSLRNHLWLWRRDRQQAPMRKKRAEEPVIEWATKARFSLGPAIGAFGHRLFVDLARTVD